MKDFGSWSAFDWSRLIRWRSGLILGVFLLAGFVVYWPALEGNPLWDDGYLVNENPFFRSPIFALEVFRHFLFFDSFSTYYRPVQNWSYMVDYWIWRGAPMGYHATNILLHVLSAFLLSRLLKRLLPSLLHGSSEPERRVVAETVACVIAFVWLVHPIHNAAVAYISGRADSLASFFALSSWLLVFQAQGSRKTWARVALSILAGMAMLIALCSKEIALIWLCLMLLHAFAFDREHTLKQKAGMMAGLVVIFGIYAVLHALPSPRPAIAGGAPDPFAARFLLMLRALGDYTSLIFFPGRLTMDRTLTNAAMYRDTATWFAHIRLEYLTILGSLTIGGFAWFLTRREAGRLAAFGAGWFVLAFLPISNLWTLNAEVAEHWIYLASIGYLMFLAACLLPAAARAPRLAATLCALALVALGARTWMRAGDWADEERFLKGTIAAGGGSPRILNNLANLYGTRGQLDKQEQVLRRTLELFPGYPPVRINLGINLTRQGRHAEAEPFLDYDQGQTRAIATNLRQAWRASINLAHTRHEAGRTEEALAILAAARKEFPEVWELVALEAQIQSEHQGTNTVPESVVQFAEAHWWHRQAWIKLGALRFAAGESDAAIAALRHASRLDLYDAKALAGIAQIEVERARFTAALDAQLEAMARDPDQPSQYLALANILEKLGRKAEASAALRKARSLTLDAQRGS